MNTLRTPISRIRSATPREKTDAQKLDEVWDEFVEGMSQAAEKLCFDSISKSVSGYDGHPEMLTTDDLDPPLASCHAWYLLQHESRLRQEREEQRYSNGNRTLPLVVALLDNSHPQVQAVASEFHLYD